MGFRHEIPLYVVLLALASASISQGCAPGLHVVHTVDLVEVPTTEPGSHGGRSKLQLSDGSIVVFPRGMSIASDRVTGGGTRYGLDGSVVSVESVSLDSVVAAQSFVTRVHAGKTAAMSGVSTVIGTAAVLLGCGVGVCDEEEATYDRSGPRARDLPFATAPAGAQVSVEAAAGQSVCEGCGSTLQGELLAVEDTALLVLRGHTQLVVVPRSGVRRLRIEGLGAADLATLEGRTRARLVSRYPGGITPAMRSQLELIYGRRPDPL